MYYYEWNLFEESGDLFLHRSAAPVVFQIDLDSSNGWEWTELRDVLDQVVDRKKQPLEKLLPLKNVFIWEELWKRLFSKHSLVSWSDAEVGHVHQDDLPEPAREFLRLVDTPTTHALEKRNRLKETGLHFDGSWRPSLIEQVIGLLLHVGAFPVKDVENAWFFKECTTAQHGALVHLYEIHRATWGFALRGLGQQEVIRDLEAFLHFFPQAH